MSEDSEARVPGQPYKAGAAATTDGGTVQPRENSLLHILSDDRAWPVRTAWLVGNQPGVTVGKPLPETKMNLFDGSQWSSSQTTGKVLVLAYFATF